jgi:hypothetical protein
VDQGHQKTETRVPGTYCPGRQISEQALLRSI